MQKSRKPCRVLHIINGMGSGGAEADIMNWYRGIDKNEIQFDFLVRTKQDFYFEEIKSLGGKIYMVAPFPSQAIKNYRQTLDFLKKHREYKTIHVHGNAPIYLIPLLIGKKLDVPQRIFHLHSTKSSNILGKWLSIINKYFFLNKWATKVYACSDAAGRFGCASKYYVIKNAIDVKKYQKNKKEIREKYRNELAFEDDSVIIGHVGRFLPVKNQGFILDCFVKLLQYEPHAGLVLVGTGPLLTDAKHKAELLGVKDKVRFLGERKDVPDLLNCFDAMIFPSRYEGVPLVVLEAQAASLPVLCADSITSEVCITHYAERMSLLRGPEAWSVRICSMLKEQYAVNVEDAFEQSGYDLQTTIKFLNKEYQEAGNCSEE